MAQRLDTTVAPTPRADAFVFQSSEVPLFGGGRARRIKIRRRITALVAGFLALAAVTFVLTQRNTTTNVSLDQAVAQFRAADARAASGAQATGFSVPVAGGSGGAASRLVRDAERPRQEGPGARNGVTAKADTPYTFPTEGVYTYRTTGGEKVSMFGASHTYPSETHATVRQLDGCQWENRNDVIKEHVDTRTWCNEPGRTSQVMQRREVEFFGQRDGATMKCAPPVLVAAKTDVAGVKSSGHCSDGNGTEAELLRTYFGHVHMKVDGREVDAIKVRVDGTMTGRVRGTSTDIWWLTPDTSMTLRWDRTVDTLAKAFGTDIRYTEDASFVLESLEPRR